MMPESMTTGLEALSSGWFVLCLLGIISIWAWTLIIGTALQLRALSGPGSSVRSSLAATAEELLRGHADFCARIAAGPLRKRLRQRVIRTRIEAGLHGISANVGTVLLLASLAPLLGLLGTVEGMIVTFKALAIHGNADNTALTEGISKALVTTQGGLLVAIPSLLAGGVLFRKVRKARNSLRVMALRAVAAEASPPRSPAGANLQGGMQ
ncbi:MotA/TolQ/ExbB proton channel family protein [Desulfovibrio psychrotolerans]|uniref:Flagellar motor protein MotA n=1 Tax=Desulfovibrio psychrotolerans TaxID=415242 RepID=A0A7J0BRD9_9BACT|nr:MotA/TolQ/ExbB proton channel family protein [Desulfovibrio psychrotolerans]GFM36276.1 flagellar motor protein MotA [Desulfovibrio psychrotolerans]